MDVVTWIVELAVGVGCLAGGIAAIRIPRLRVVGVVLLLAGAAASIHAVASLAN